MKTIVVVDHSSFCRELLALVLRRSGFEAMTAANGLAALPLLQRCPPDLVILGLKLPEMDGLKTLRLIRTTPQLQALPVFMLTEEDNRACIVQATQIGIQAYILKAHFQLEPFLQRVYDHIGSPTKPSAPSPAIEEIWDTVT